MRCERGGRRERRKSAEELSSRADGGEVRFGVGGEALQLAVFEYRLDCPVSAGKEAEVSKMYFCSHIPESTDRISLRAFIGPTLAR